METEYVFDTASELGRDQVDHLATLYDDVTVECLEWTGVGVGARCLEVGAGGGSIARWLAARVRPDGSVVAVDLDTDHLAAQPGLRVHRHDINDGVPPGAPFDLIHARLVLMHLVRRREILASLVDALAPGGWLVLGDLTDRLPWVLGAPTPGDADLFDRVLDTGMNVLAPAVNLSVHWASETEDRMRAAGMVGIDRHSVRTSANGGTPGCLLFGNYMRQVEPMLLEAGVSASELQRFHELTFDPRLHVEFYELAYTMGQKPVESV